MRWLALTLLMSVPALAQQLPAPDPEPEIVYPDVEEHEFDDLDVRATRTGPDGVVVLEPPRLQFTPMVRPRTSFAREMKASVDTVK